MREWRYACRIYGFNQGAASLFKQLDAEGMGSLSLEQVGEPHRKKDGLKDFGGGSKAIIINSNEMNIHLPAMTWGSLGARVLTNSLFTLNFELDLFSCKIWTGTCCHWFASAGGVPWWVGLPAREGRCPTQAGRDLGQERDQVQQLQLRCVDQGIPRDTKSGTHWDALFGSKVERWLSIRVYKIL